MILLAMFGLYLGAATIASPIHYDVQTLNLPAGREFGFQTLNNSGWFGGGEVRQSCSPNICVPQINPVLFDGQTLLQLDPGAWGAGRGPVVDLKDTGVAVGRRFVYSKGALIDDPLPGSISAINNFGIAVGTATVYKPDRTAYCAVITGASTPFCLEGSYDISLTDNNDRGDLIGSVTDYTHYHETAEIYSYAFRRFGDKTEFFSPIVVDGKVLYPNDALAINNSGEIAATATDFRGTIRGFRFLQGNITLLDLLPGDTNNEAFTLNDGGTLVGVSYTSRASQRWFVSFQGRTTEDLNRLLSNCPGCTVVSVAAINNHGQILALGLVNDQRVWMVLTPSQR